MASPAHSSKCSFFGCFLRLRSFFGFNLFNHGLGGLLEVGIKVVVQALFFEFGVPTLSEVAFEFNVKSLLTFNRVFLDLLLLGAILSILTELTSLGEGFLVSSLASTQSV